MDFACLLKSYAAKNGPMPIELDEPWRGCGDRYFLVLRTFIFDLHQWQFVGWVNRNSTYPQPMSALPELMGWVIESRGWKSLVSQTVSPMDTLKTPTLFPLPGIDRDIADLHSPLTWVRLSERSCWINREMERCACSACYPERDVSDYSSVQLTNHHCVRCACVKCCCPQSGLGGIEASPTALLAPRQGCVCDICVASQKD